MPSGLIPASVGAPALAALHTAIADAKADDPLSRVTVIVPTNYVGLSIRRSLARQQGVAGVTFLTPYRLAELLGAAPLAAQRRRPVSTPVVAAAIRQVLDAEPGMFAPVLTHPSTERALVRAHRELSDVSPEGLDTLASAGRRAHEVVRIHRGTNAVLVDSWYDEHDLMTSATAVIEDGAPFLEDLGVILVHLPLRLSNAASTMLAGLAKRTDVLVIAGFTGEPKADVTLLDTLRRLGIDAEAPAEVPIPSTREIISTADADDEVRMAVRRVIDASREGIPLERIAILYGSDRPYSRQLHEHLGAAKIPFNGSAVRTIGEALLGKSLLRILALTDRDFRRDDVFTLLGSASLRDAEGKFVPTSAWERVSRTAGIVGGAHQWVDRLDHHLEDLRLDRQGEERTEGREFVLRQLQRQTEWATGLRDFIVELSTDLNADAVGSSWREKARWAQGLIRRYLGAEATRSSWPASEIAAAEKVEAALERLSALDSVEPNPSLAVFRRTLELELDSGLGRQGRFGEGVLVGPISAAFGLDLERVIIVGLAEGVYPSHPRDDSLLPDHERRLLDGELPLRRSHLADQHRDLLAALAAASAGTVLCFPRGDLRRSTERTASRWLLQVASTLAETDRISGDELADYRDQPWLSEMPSFAGGIARLEFPATEQEFSLRSLLEHRDAGSRVDGADNGGVLGHHLAQSSNAFRRGAELRQARRGRHFTRFDGNLSHLDIPSPTANGVVMSPTRLEHWADCPHRYLLQTVLRINEVERPDLQLRVSALDKGNIIHRSLDEFFTGAIEQGAPAPGDYWTDEQRKALRDITIAQCEHYERRGLTGKKLFWDRDKRRILSDLDKFLSVDNINREVWQSFPVKAELGFGLVDRRNPNAPHDSAIDLVLGDGRTLRFRGSIDRLDRGTDGSLRVLDYKTGKSKYYNGLDETNPIENGRRLQLPIYALAARAHANNPDASVWAGYWFLNEESKFTTVGYHVTPEVADIVDSVLTTIVDNIEAGVFPAHPPPPSTFNAMNCRYCDPDLLGTSERFRQWERKKSSVELNGFRRLVEPEKLDV